MANLLLTLCIGSGFGYAFYRMRVPGGLMVGAVIGVSILSIFFDLAYIPTNAKYASQIAAGAFIGCSVEKSDIQRLKHIAKPAAVLLTALLLLNIMMGVIIYMISPLDLITSLMGSVPGGMSDIPIISADMGADAPKVAVLQFVRMVTGIGLFPMLISMISRREDKKANIESTPITPPMDTKSEEYSTIVYIQTLGVVTLFGIIGKMTDIPAGALLFSMIGVICLKFTFKRAYLSSWIKRFAQILAGAYIGSSISYYDVLELKLLIIPALLLVAGYFSACLLVGKILSKFFDMSLKEAMLVATPAGAADMALISLELGVQSADLIVLQVIRLMVVVSVFPQIISLIVKLMG